MFLEDSEDATQLFIVIPPIPKDGWCSKVSYSSKSVCCSYTLELLFFSRVCPVRTMYMYGMGPNLGERCRNVGPTSGSLLVQRPQPPQSHQGMAIEENLEIALVN
jgi:hypothetical protein